jgi:hypothetical protein
VIVRLFSSLAALCAGVAGIAIVAVLLHRTPGPVATSTTSVGAAATAAPAGSSAPAAASFPAPPPSAVVFTHQDLGTVLALAVTPHVHALGLQVSALGPTGHGTSGLDVSFGVGAGRTPAIACGAGCYRATVAASAHPSAVVVAVQGAGLGTVWHQRLPGVWPAADATALVDRAAHVWRSLRSLAYVEHLASDPQHAVTSVWRIGAPDRVAYRVQGGYAGIVIGGQRWDKAPGGRWVESVQSAPLTQPVPTWDSVANAHLLGSGTVGGRPVWIVSFFDRTIPAWFTVSIEKSTMRTLNAEMMATAHFMHDAYGAFNRTRPISPP